MKKRTRCFALGSLWFGVAALQVYHLHAGEVGWVEYRLALLVYVLGGCYYFGAGVRDAVRSRSY